MDCDEALPVKIVIDMSFEPFMDESVSKTFKTTSKSKHDEIIIMK